MAAPVQHDRRWDLDVFYSSPVSPEFTTAKSEVQTMLKEVRREIERVESSSLTRDQLRTLIISYEELIQKFRIVSGYISLKVSADSNDQESQKEMSALQPIMTDLSKLGRRFQAFIGQLDSQLWEGDDEYGFPLARIHEASRRLMEQELEMLAADLNETGASAWERLYDDYSSNIEVELNGEKVPMSRIRGLAHDTDPQVRRAAFEAELQAWKAHETTLSACMNAIKGEANVLAERRGWPEQIDEALFRANMDRASLDAMLEAAEDAFPKFRKYLQAKAKLLGHSGGLPFYDLFAAIGRDRSWTWEEAEEFVTDGFRSYSDKLADFAQQTFTEQWHDVYPRPGKRDGAFCAGMTPGVSRMLHNFKESFGGASTLAHELGHAYHNLCLQDRTPLQKSTPMTLAETASIFCETIIKRRALQNATGSEKLAILDASLQGSTQVTVDISSRFRFERDVIAKRKQRALTAEEMCAIMREAQLSTYGDGLDPDNLHPYMWAAKPHYYSDRAFYNFPYMFGLLFALGLYRIYQESPNGFHERYDSLLSRTGLAMAADLTQEFGIDIGTKEFWAGSLAVIADDIEEFCRLAESIES